MVILEPSAFHRIEEDIIRGENVQISRKLFRDLCQIYRDPAGLAEDALMYTVCTHCAGDEKKPGDLYWGLTILEPVLVSGECNMTRGHFHTDRNCAEYYFGIAGEGLLLLMDGDGHTFAEKVMKGSLHHIDGRYAHRLVNTGDTRLEVGACWPTCAGHDYRATEAMPFGCRVFRENGCLHIEQR